MRRISRIVFLALFVLVVGGAVFLATWDIPAPVASVEKVIPDERFRK